MAIIENQLRNAFNCVLESHLMETDGIRGHSSDYVIPEISLANITEELLEEVSIRIYIKG